MKKLTFRQIKEKLTKVDNLSIIGSRIEKKDRYSNFIHASIPLSEIEGSIKLNILFGFTFQENKVCCFGFERICKGSIALIEEKVIKTFRTRIEDVKDKNRYIDENCAAYGEVYSSWEFSFEIIDLWKECIEDFEKKIKENFGVGIKEFSEKMEKLLNE